MSGRFSKVARNRRSAASFASSEPGSVMTANCSGRPLRAQNVSRWLRVSMVEPDFDDARKRVASSGHSWLMRATAAGSVVSSTRSSARPPEGGKVRARTSGKRLEPPMPMTTTWVRPSAAAVVANVSSRSRSARISGATSSHPSRSATSVGSSCQTVWSRAQIRSTHLSVDETGHRGLDRSQQWSELFHGGFLSRCGGADAGRGGDDVRGGRRRPPRRWRRSPRRRGPDRGTRPRRRPARGRPRERGARGRRRRTAASSVARASA